jgi:hypothetical protein
MNKELQMKKKFVCYNEFAFQLALKFFSAIRENSDDAKVIKEKFCKTKGKRIAKVQCLAGKIPENWESFIEIIESNNDIEKAFEITDEPEEILGFLTLDEMELAFKYYNDVEFHYIETPDEFEVCLCQLSDESGEEKEVELIVPIIQQKNRIFDLENIFWERARWDTTFREYFQRGLEICPEVGS